MRHSRQLAAAFALSVLAGLVTATAADASPAPRPSSVPAFARTVVDRTETSTTYRLADGRTVTELHSAPIRVRRAGGAWADIDTVLVEEGGAVRPRAGLGDTRFSAGGKGAFARLRLDSGRRVELGWDGELPRPVINGSKAVYRGVVADGAGDLVATALPAGLRFDVVLNRRPTGPVEVKVPVTAKGLTLGEAEGGRLSIQAGDTVLATSSAPVVYDADSSHARTQRKREQQPGRQAGRARTSDITATVADAAGGGKTLLLKPSAAFLADPATTYPVTVDPSVVLPLSNDTDVNSVFDGNNVSGGYLKAGTEADGEKARTYLRFDTRGLKTPTKAVLKLTNLDAPACGPTVSAGIQVRRVTSHWDATTQTWAPQPTSTTEDAVVSTEGSQLGACGSGTMTWDVTAMVAKWAAGTANHGVVLQSPTETAQANYRVFAATENTDGLAAPVLEVTSDEVITPGEGEDPADPGPADFKPGYVDPPTGNWMTSAIDLSDDGLLVTRNHTAGQRLDVARPNEKVLGPLWQLEPLGGVLGHRLKDYSANGYVEIALNVGTESYRFQANPDGTFASTDGGGALVKNVDGTFTQTLEDADIVYTWSKIGQEYMVTAIGSQNNGRQAIQYDATGRFSRILSPLTAEDCVSTPAACSTATFQYATTTTATSSIFGDIAGQLKAIVHDAAGDPVPVTAVSYQYDSAKRLRKAEDTRQVDGDPVRQSTYTYDSQGNIKGLTTTEDGTWTLTYSAPGKMTSAGAAPTAFAATAAAASCPYASDYLLRGRCKVRVDVEKDPAQKVFRNPFWKGTLTGGSVMGITNDGCSSAPNSPMSGVSFKAACDAHDYGYGLIRNRKNGETNGLPPSKRTAVDAVFYTILKERICAAVTGYDIGPRGQRFSRKAKCLDWARTYYNFVRAWGNGFI
ncbi:MULTISPECIES: phospholipase A2 [unclassified Streptomyces]|uniref:phospholipase A2 n=1 Tax=unclassified Streptomyces TaxID=2593676 RepID=UPI000B590E4F|nr:MULTISPECIES: phospholipase A2 [unclassified Streptomyces]